MTRLGIVLNPVKVDDAAGLVDLLAKRCADAGWEAPVVVETTPEDPGVGQARGLVADGVHVVVAAGGDGTVRAVCQALAGTDAVLALVPSGTGNLLARNLGVPLTAAEAADVVVSGTDRRIDVGVLEDDGEGSGGGDSEDGTVFAVMAGIGFDAAMMEEVPETLKGRVGWPAYLVGAVRGLRRPQLDVTVTLDGERTARRRVRTVLVANVGTLQGGVELLPDAAPDDDVLDVALVSARHLRDWLHLVTHVVRRHHHDEPGRRLDRQTARRVVVRAVGVHPRQVDGDLVAEGAGLRVRIEPAALTVRVPAPPADDPTRGARR